MARFVHWPSGAQVKDHVLTIKSIHAKSYWGVAVAECSDDFEVLLLGDGGKGPPRGSARLDFTKRRGTVVPILLTNASDNDQVRVLHKDTGNDWSTPLEIKVDATPIGPVIDRSKPEIRKSIVDLARTFVADAHYLWGTAGNVPGERNGNPGGGKAASAVMRAYSLDKATLEERKVLGVNMAVCTTNGYCTCAGRAERSGMPAGGNLDAYVKDREADIAAGRTDQTSWRGAGPAGLHPRRYHFRGTLKGTAPAWGESCVGRRHFDCVGLVNYCYALHYKSPGFGLDLKEYREPKMGTVQITNESDLMDADILIVPPHKHIGMLYQHGNNWFVVQATDTAYGLTDDSPYDPKKWDRFRMSGSYLVPRKV